MPARYITPLLAAILLLILAADAQAARIGELTENDPWQQARRFFTFADPGLRLGLIGALLFGATCGLLGSFIVVRKMALIGDAISHAVLPGVALGFLWSMDKDPLAILVGATVAGLTGSLVVELIQRTTKIKQDAALGIVLASFFAVGLCMIRMIQNNDGASKITGLKSYLFGDVAVLGRQDVLTIAGVVTITVLLVILLYRQLLTIGFDREFALSIGLPVRLLDGLFQLFLAFSIVVALQAVGVVLVSALLITPAAAAYLLVNRMHHMLWVAAAIGMFAAVLGVFFSFLGSDLPTGPFMVLGASSVFLVAYLFAPRHGRITRWLRHRSRRRDVSNENTLKSIYRILERDAVGHDPGKVVQIGRLAGERRVSKADLDKDLRRLQRVGAVEFSGQGEDVTLTGSGLEQAQRVVRNHRLWELYLTNEADYASNHVHDDAEKIEHFLSEEKVAEIERQLDYPEIDPHGQPIPGRGGA